MKIDPFTILAIGEKLAQILPSALSAFRQASADSGADDATLAQLDSKYTSAIEHEKEVMSRPHQDGL